MPIDFAPERWDAVRRNYGQWWAGELERPLIRITLPASRDADRPCPSAPVLSQQTCSDLSIPVENLVDRLDWELSRETYLGDSFPFVNMDVFGPGVGAAFAGARLDPSIKGQVWFHSPCPDASIEDIHIEYQPGNIWLERLKDIYAAAMKRWQGQVLVGMTDLGGNLDILQTFVGANRLLLAFYDQPDQVKRLVWEQHELWHRAYNELNEVLMPVNPGYSDWAYIFSDRPSYIFQCDFCYMLGPEMFREFVAPELRASFRRLGRAFYHLDGPGQIPHLDQLIEMNELNGIQWIAGTGSPGETEWPTIRRKVANSGKRAQTFGSLEELAIIIGQAGSGKGIHHRTYYPWNGSESIDDIRRKLAVFGVED